MCACLSVCLLEDATEVKEATQQRPRGQRWLFFFFHVQHANVKLHAESKGHHWVVKGPLASGSDLCKISRHFLQTSSRLRGHSFKRLPGIMQTVMLQHRNEVSSLKTNLGESGRTFAEFRVVADAISGTNTVSAKYTAQHVNG